jgi:hypothetical protein
MPCAAGPITDCTVKAPDSEAARAGQACVPAGGLGRLLQKNTEMPPLTAGWPKWMCACVASARRPE